jgi:ParB-like chromosome segregation protein Spo0J
MSQDITFVECKKIIAAKSGKKGLNNNVLDLLHDSISKEGLFHPIAVRPAKDKPGFYKIVLGEHRFYVVAKMIKDEAIACRVFTDMSDEQAELAALSENVCRGHAKTTDRLLALRKWQEVYQKHFPQLVGRKASGGSRWSNSTKPEAKRKAIEDERAKDRAEAAAEAAQKSDSQFGHRPDDETEQPMFEVEIGSLSAGEPEKKQARHQSYRERVQAVTGMSKSAVSRDIQINNGLSEEQVYVLGIVECTLQGMEQIIEAMADLTNWDEIVNLVASGMEVEQAIAEVLSLTTTKDEASRIK